jgi:hypothetical protein
MVFSPADNDSPATPAAPILEDQMFFLNQFGNVKSACGMLSRTEDGSGQKTVKRTF